MRRLQLFSRIFLALLVAALLTALWSTSKSATAQAGCGASYGAAVAAITDAHLDQGLERKLLTKVQNAQQYIQSGQPDSLASALEELDVALHLLDSPATKQIPAAVRDQIRQAIEGFKACLTSPPVDPTGTIVVTVITAAAEPAPGATVHVQGLDSSVNVDGVTDATGIAGFQVPLGQYWINGCVSSSWGARCGSAPAGVAQQGDVINIVVQVPAIPTGTLRITVIGATGEFAAGATVSIRDHHGMGVDGVTDANGVVQFQVPIDAFSITACQGSVCTTISEVVAQQGEFVDRLIVLTPTGS